MPKAFERVVSLLPVDHPELWKFKTALFVVGDRSASEPHSNNGQSAMNRSFQFANAPAEPVAASEARLIAVARASYTVGGGEDVGLQGISVKQMQNLYHSAIKGKWLDSASDHLVAESLIQASKINMEVFISHIF